MKTRTTKTKPERKKERKKEQQQQQQQQQQNTNKNSITCSRKKQQHIFVYVSIHTDNLTIDDNIGESPDQYLLHAGSHTRAYSNTFIYPKCRVLKKKTL